ncbi:MAG: CvpA family protein [Chitinophagaceae bacterium]|jgi:membrane protein required for colicin V production|nr:CvpA family protein [Chitinophagaceae bacterium]
MAIDIVVMALLALAIFKGIRKGLVVALFSWVAIVVGAAAALKLSGKAGAWMAAAMPSLAKWIPLLAFVGVFIAVILLVRLLAKLLEETLEWTMLGWANKLGGILFFALLYLMVASIALFYLDKLALLSSTARNTSVTYPLLQPLAPAIMEGLGKLIPLFKDLFTDLEAVLEQAAG